MKNLLDKLVTTLALSGVMITPIVTYAVLNVSTRPEIISIALELPKQESSSPKPTNVSRDIQHESVYTDEDLLCMAKNIYFEAKNQSIKGQLAVGLVTLNRVRSRFYPNTVCGVVYQRQQFSWYWDGLPDRPKNQKSYETALLLASALLEGSIEDFTDGADHYHADYVDPQWRHAMVMVTQIETHIFYRSEAP